MPRIKNVLLASLVLAAPSLFSHSAQALEYKNSFGSINAGYADWNSGFVNVHRGEVWKATADFGINFKEAEFYSFYESNVLNHSVAGRNHTVSAMTHVRLFDSNYTFFGKLYGQWETPGAMTSICFMAWAISAGQVIGGSLNRILDYIINLAIMFRRNTGKPVAGTVMYWDGQRPITLRSLMRNSFSQTGMKLNLIAITLTRNSNMATMALMAA